MGDPFGLHEATNEVSGSGKDLGASRHKFFVWHAMSKNNKQRSRRWPATTANFLSSQNI
jgi:hypothetical protein